MLPVTISLGLINFNLLINSFFGTLVSDQAPAAIDKAFRVYMLPQGIFSVAVATVVFPTLARFAARQDYDGLRSTMANGMRQILLLLVPAAAAVLVLSEPMIRLVYQRGEFDAAQTDLVATALFWFSLLAALQRALPPPHPHLLQPPASLGADRDLGRQPGGHRARGAGPLLAIRRRWDRGRHRGRDRRQRHRPVGDPAAGARRARTASAGQHRDQGDNRGRAPRGRSAIWSGTSSTRRSAATRSPRSSPWARRSPRAPPPTSARSSPSGCPRATRSFGCCGASKGLVAGRWPAYPPGRRYPFADGAHP